MRQKNLRNRRRLSKHKKRIIERKRLHQKSKTARQTIIKIVWRAVFSFLAELSGAKAPMAALHSGISVILNLKPHLPLNLRLEITQMNYDMIHSGKRIQQLRIEKGYTQDELAAALNINRSYVSRIESGKKGCSVDVFI